VRAPILGLDDGPLRGGIGVATEGGGREVTSKACGGLPGVVGDGGESGGLFEAVGDTNQRDGKYLKAPEVHSLTQV